MWLCCQHILLCVCLKALGYSHICGLSHALCSASVEADLRLLSPELFPASL